MFRLVAVKSLEETLLMLLDHVVLFVDDLEDAVRMFSSFGFTVTPGGINGPTHNALIAFDNETYIELIALRSVAVRRLFKLLRYSGLLSLRRLIRNDLNNRLFGWFSKRQGFRDVCFRASSLEAVSKDCRQKGYALTAIIPFNRHRPDGVTVSWYLAGAVDDVQPFFIEDKTPLSYRIPDGPARLHQNGALGIIELVTRSPLNFSAENVSTTSQAKGLRGGFCITIKTASCTRELNIPKVYAADIRLAH